MKSSNMTTTNTIKILAVLVVCALLGVGFQLLTVQPSSGDVYMKPMAPLRELIYHKELNTSYKSQINATGVSQIPDKKLVLIVTYMRSGSSLTGDILQHSPEAFYVYEPFRSIRKYNNETTINYTNGTIRKPPISTSYEKKMSIYHWMTCQLRKLPKSMLFDSFLNYGLKTKTFPECLKQKGVRNKTLLLHGCISQLQRVCEHSPTIVIKTIRFSIEDTEYFLNEFPNLKIIHLVRDPRATLFSEAKFGMCSNKFGGQLVCTSIYCSLVENDFLSFERLRIEYKNRLERVKYEHIAKAPLETSKKMYDFLGLGFNNNVKEYIFNITMAGNQDNCPICTVRSNSSAHIDTWKEKMSKKFIQIINDRCNFIIKQFEFDIFPDVKQSSLH